MSERFGLHLLALWIKTIYARDENWDRLRTIGLVKAPARNMEELIFFPVRQRAPALTEGTHPEMKDPALAAFYESFNTVSDACDFLNEPYRCRIQREPPDKLGLNLKVLLRKSNPGYPDLFTNLVDVPSRLFSLSKVPAENPYAGYVPVMDVHAFDDCIIVAGGPIADASDWPNGFGVAKSDYGPDWDYAGPNGDDIVLPADVGDRRLGELVKGVWKARKKSLASIGP